MKDLVYYQWLHHQVFDPPTEAEKQTGGLIVNNETEWGFSYNNKLYKTTTAICKAVLNRDGQTNEWRGPQHVYILRDGSWKRFNTL
jgi:hypothetical protein